MEVLCVLVGGGLLLWWMRKTFGEPAESEEARLKADALRRRDVYEAPARAPRAFSLYEDARTEEGLLDGVHLSFSTSHLASKPPAVVTGLTFEGDRLYVLRGQGMTIFPFVPSLTLAIVSGRTAGFREQVMYRMELTSADQAESARFPLSFAGWLDLVDRVRRAGGTIEMGADLPGRMRELIEQPLPGDEHHDPVVIRAAAPAEAPSARPSKCPTCGANFGRNSSCDYCGYGA